jgi:hypothetical protein
LSNVSGISAGSKPTCKILVCFAVVCAVAFALGVTLSRSGHQGGRNCTGDTFETLRYNCTDDSGDAQRRTLKLKFVQDADGFQAWILLISFPSESSIRAIFVIHLWKKSHKILVWDDKSVSVNK